MTNYRAYFSGGSFRKGPSEEDLKLKKAMVSRDGKKIANALNEMLRAENICTQILHLEGEEVFGSNKRKLDLLIGFKGNSHRLNKVNFSHPWVQIRLATNRVQLEFAVEEFNIGIPDIQLVIETNCDTLE